MMGLIELAMVSLCLNLTNCPGEENYTAFNVELAYAKARIKALEDDLRGKHLKITTLQNEPLSYAVNENGTWVGKGISFEILNFLQDKYQFNYTLVLPEDDILGNEKSGVLGMLSREIVDVSAAFLPVMTSFWQYVHYSKSLDIGEWVVLMKRPTESATGSGLFAPFTSPVWALIILSLLVVGPLIYLIILTRARLCEDEHSRIYPLPSCIWFVYSALLKQGSTLSPTTDSSRIMFATWWIFITILTAYYTANLTAFLTLSKFTLPIKDASDIKAKHYRWVTKRGNAVQEVVTDYDALSDMGDPLRGSHGEYLSESDDIILNNLVAKRNVMFIREKPIVDYIMYNDYLLKTRMGLEGTDRCTFVITTWSVFKMARAFAYSRNFKYRDLFDSTLQHIVESGILKYMIREGLPDTQICPLDLGSTERRLRNVDLFMTYMVVMVGFAVSGFIFITELCIMLYKRKRFNKKRPIHPSNNTAANKFFKKETSQEMSNQEKVASSAEEEDHRNFPPPPPYHTLFYPPFAHFPNAKKTYINGRIYWVVKSAIGETQLIPVRTPSALLFHYANLDEGT